MSILPIIKTFAVMTCFFAAAAASAAVHISPNKTGQAIIVPFYTVSNQMNTLLSLNNTRDETKAIKIHIKEANQGQAVASFNVYLAPQDMWTMGMGQFGGEFKMISFDSSCTTGFMNNQAIQTEDDWLWENGTIEIIEMGVVDTHEIFNLGPINCETLSAYWQDGGTWADDSEAHIRPATIGLHAEVTLMDVEQGHAANIPVIHLDGFYGDDDIQHTAAGADAPNLDSGTHDSLVMYDGEAITTRWPTGYEAVSALLMKNTLSNEYNLEPGVLAKTDWIISLPTLHYHLNNPSSNKPFKVSEDGVWIPGQYDYSLLYFDREGNGSTYFCPVICTPVPPGMINHSVTNFALINSFPTTVTPLLTNLGSENTQPLSVLDYFYPPNTEQNGKLIFSLREDGGHTIPNDRGKSTHSDNLTHTYHGLPVAGFTYTQFTNSVAQPDLLAQYAFVRKHFGRKRIDIQESVK